MGGPRVDRRNREPGGQEHKLGAQVLQDIRKLHFPPPAVAHIDRLPHTHTSNTQI